MAVTDIIKPVITEKSLRLAQLNQYTFAVAPSATKAAVKQAVESLFKVTVLKTRLVKLAGKPKKSGKKRLLTHQSPRYKALVTLKPGDSIEYFQSPKEKTKKSKSKSVKKDKNQ